MSFLAVFCAAFLCTLSSDADAQQRKALVEVDTDAMNSETQFSAPVSSNQMNLIWTIPIEFWKAVFEKDPTISAEQRAEIVGELENYLIVAVVQADVSNKGVFSFYSMNEVKSALSMSFTDADGNERPVTLATEVGLGTQQFLAVMKPTLTAAMGNLGENFHFMVVKDDDGKGDRVWDPYEFGTFTVNLKDREGKALTAKLEGPIDALFVPRKCPNGKDAHVTWKYCPWTGEELK